MKSTTVYSKKYIIHLCFLLLTPFAILVGNVSTASACWFNCNYTPSPPPSHTVTVTSPNGQHTTTIITDGKNTIMVSDHNNDGDIRDDNEVITTGPGGNGNDHDNYSGGTTAPVVSDDSPLGDITSLGSRYKGPNTSCEAVTGWSCDNDFPNNPVSLEVHVDGKFYTDLVTSIPAPGLIDPSWAPAQGVACKASSNALWGFRYVTPLALKDGVRHEIEVFAINQGPLGTSRNARLPNETWLRGGRKIPIQCGIPGLPVDLGATLPNPGLQTEGVAFTISPKIANYGRSETKDPFIVRVQIDKKDGTAANGWLYEGTGVNGDKRLQTTIPAGFEAHATTSYNFTNVNLPAGEYRARAIADPYYVIEPEGGHQIENNTSNWQYFTVKAGMPASDLSFDTFSITDKCEISDMTQSKTCPATEVSFVLNNSGTYAIPTNGGVPYSIETKMGNSPWESVTTGSYKESIPARGVDGVDGVSAKITATVANLKLGITSLRAVVNPDPGQANLKETNFDNNISNVITQMYQFKVAQVTLTTDNILVRYGTPATLKWSVKTQYEMSCTLAGAFTPSPALKFNVLPNDIKTTDIITSHGISNTQLFTLTCKPKSSAAGVPPDVVTDSVRVEVVPLVQEI